MALRYIISFSSSPIISVIADFLYTLTGNMPYTVGQQLMAGSSSVPLPLTAQDNEITSATATNNYAQITLTTPGVPTIVHAYSGYDIYILPPGGAQINNIGINQPFLVRDGSSIGFNCIRSSQFYTVAP